MFDQKLPCFSDSIHDLWLIDLYREAEVARMRREALEARNLNQSFSRAKSATTSGLNKGKSKLLTLRLFSR